MHLYRLLLPALLLPAACMTAPARADISLRIMGDQGKESTIYVNGGRCRLETTGLPGYAIIDLRDHSLVLADPARDEYSTLSEAQLRERLDKLDRVRASLAPHAETLRDGMQLLPTEQRALFEQFLAGQAPPAAGMPVRLVADGGMQHFAGLACRHHLLLRGEREVGDACLLQGPGGLLSAADYNTLDTVMALLRTYSGRAGGLLALAGNKSALLQSKTDGIPVALRDFGSGESYRVVAASPAPLDEKLFINYRHYKQVDTPAIPGLF